MKTSIWLSFFVFYLNYVLPVNSQECVCVPYDACNYDYSLKENAERHETLFFTQDGPRPACDSAIDVCCDLSTNDDRTTVTSQPFEPTKENLSYEKSICGQRGEHSGEGDNGENVDAEFGEFPWTVAVLNKERYLCGGALINDKAVLTGAYDINKLPASDLIVRVGQSRSKQEFFQDVKVLVVYRHPKFDEKTFVNNYAVLILTEPVKSQPYIKPICLPTSNNTYELMGCIETGWESSCNVAIDEKSTLKKTFLDVTDTESCKNVYHMPNMNDKNQYNDYQSDYDYRYSNSKYYNNYYNNYGHGRYGYGGYGYGNYGYGNRYDKYGYGNRYGNYRYRRDNYRNDKNNLDKSIICAVDKNFKTPYTGNGGSPLICPLKDNHKRYVQVGIAIVTECKEKYKSGLYANVSEAKPWIDQVMNENNLPTDLYEV